MTTSLATATQQAAADAIAARADSGAGAGTVKVYTGAQPGNANLAATGTLLCTFTLSDPAYGPANSSGVAALVVTPALTTAAVAAGTAGWFRLASSTPGTVLDGSVSTTGLGGGLELDNTTVVLGQTVTITSGRITMPAS